MPAAGRNFDDIHARLPRQLHQRLAINTELVDEICLEDEFDSQRIK